MSNPRKSLSAKGGRATGQTPDGGVKPPLRVGFLWEGKTLEVEELAEALGLLAAYRDFGLFFVVHFQHEA